MHSFSETFESARQEYISKGMVIARVLSEQKELYTILLNDKEYKAEVTGRIMYAAESRKDFPAVGDWVAVQAFDEYSSAIIHGILPRKTTLMRKAVGKNFEEQIIASNIDIVFIVQSLDGNFNLRRLERYIVVVKESGAVPVVLLSKIDLLSPEEYQQQASEAEKVSPGIRIIPYSAKTLSHVEEIKSLITVETTVCFIGSSGVGKSTLINTLAGTEILPTRKVREADSKGVHTTTNRQLIAIQGGGFVIDTPGMRELGLWSVGDDSIYNAFPEIQELSSSCRFNDCTHVHEPHCAVLQAVDNGSLDRQRYESYLKLKREAAFIESKTNIAKQQERKAKERQMGKNIKEIVKLKKKNKSS